MHYIWALRRSACLELLLYRVALCKPEVRKYLQEFRYLIGFRSCKGYDEHFME
jgi:hypothetical protein